MIYITLDELIVNPRLLQVEYVVRGRIVKLAEELTAQGKNIVFCNIGNPQHFDQKPITFGRQLIAATEDPELLERGIYPEDVVEKARFLLENFNGNSTGSYSPTKGYECIRQAVAKHIAKSDDTDAPDIENIFLINGASEGGAATLETLITGPKDAILISRPQYPFYSAAIARFGGTAVYYDFNEEEGWTLNREQLKQTAREARNKGLNIKAMVVIDPNNPTGAMLSVDDKKCVIGLAAEYGFSIIADEVYRENTYNAKWDSFSSVLASMPEYKDNIQMINYHSASKGDWGECGKRGGWMRVINPIKVKGIDSDIVDIIEEKLMGPRLSPNTPGQVMIYAMVAQPQPGDPSYERFRQEKTENSSAIKRKADLIDNAFSQMEGVKVFGKFNAMYRFPQIWLPKGSTDSDYCIDLLHSPAGICITPGSGFSLPGHTRWATLPSEAQLNELLPLAVQWHNSSRYAR